MIFAFGIWGLYILGFLIILWISWAYYDKRYRRRPNEDGKQALYSGNFIKTSERFVDPKDGFTYQVYFNPQTGEREYVRIDD